MTSIAGESLGEWGSALLALGGSAAVGAIAAIVVLLLARRVLARIRPEAAAVLRARLTRPVLLLGLAIGVRAAIPAIALPEEMAILLGRAAAMTIIAALAWGAIASADVVEAWLDATFEFAARDNLSARRVHTKFAVVRRIGIVVVIVFAVGAMLFQVPGIRSIGAGLLASAGLAGLAVGLAARPTIETLLAGLQLALTEPINLDDVVIIEGEWGRIEEIRATYVVVHIWDKRRLVVPVQYFLTRPFQNWTRVTADLLGSVTVEVDYRAPIEEIRTAVGEIVASCPLWDREFWNLQVVEAGERSIRLRVLVSAGDSSTAWDLRCEVREKLLTWLNANHPDALPRIRIETPGDAGDETGAAGPGDEAPPPTSPAGLLAPRND